METAVLSCSGLGKVIEALVARGYRVIGPTVRDNAIVLAEIDSVADLPFGVGVSLGPGRYRLRSRPDDAVFGHSAGPQAWKPFLHPPRVRLWGVRRDGTEGVTQDKDGARGERRYAFVGVRPCDLAAIGVLDRVLAQGRYPDPAYTCRRDGTFIVAVECTEPGETCFCTSMGTGPSAGGGFDLALTELVDGDQHRFVARAGSAAGAELLAEVPRETADAATIAEAEGAVSLAAQRMSRTMPSDVHEVLAGARESSHWDDVASRCLTCGNCTLVCPTCFCTTTEDVTDVSGTHAERWQRWDSCFDIDFSFIHGGSVRQSGASRYRQWMTHKLSTWHDQFGSSGCVGCGRCIVWCPVGIDITAEAATLASSADGQDSGAPRDASAERVSGQPASAGAPGSPER